MGGVQDPGGTAVVDGIAAIVAIAQGQDLGEEVVASRGEPLARGGTVRVARDDPGGIGDAGPIPLACGAGVEGQHEDVAGAEAVEIVGDAVGEVAAVGAVVSASAKVLSLLEERGGVALGSGVGAGAGYDAG